MLARRQQPQPLGRQLSLQENPRCRKLTMSGSEVAPLLDFSSCSSFSSNSTFSSVFSDIGRSEPSSPLNQLPLATSQKPGRRPGFSLASVFRGLFPSLHALLVPACRWLSVPGAMVPLASSCPARRKVTGTFFGHRRGRVCFAIQEDPRSDPVLLLELPIATCNLVKEMASGMLRILLECERVPAEPNVKNNHRRQLWEEPLWTMYCGGQKRGFAVSRPCSDSDFHVLSAVQAVSVGAGLLPAVPGMAHALPPPPQEPRALERNKSERERLACDREDVMYMRARFERVVGSRDSEAFYMINPDCGGRGKNGGGGPELSIFLLRI